MPGITHLVLGSLFGLLLYNMNPQRFTRKHAFIFAMNSYIGPDLLGVIGIGPMYAIGHSVLGWPIFALYLLPIYTFLTRFSIDLRHLQLKDEGLLSKGQISWKKMYPLLVAGGLFHFTVDITFETKNWWSWGIESAPWKANISQFIIDMNEYQTDIPNLGIVFSIMILGLFLIINLVYQKAEHKKDIRQINAMVVGVVALYTIPLAIFGNGIMGHEPDLGAMGYFLIFFFLPIGLCELSLMPVKDDNTPIKQYNAQKAEAKLKIVVRFFFTLAAVFLLVVIAFAIDSMNNFNTFLAEANDSMRNFFDNYFVYLALGVSILALLFIVIGILLQRRAKYAQRIAMFFFVLTGIAMFPLVFWGLLRENEVIALFETNTSIKGNKQEK